MGLPTLSERDGYVATFARESATTLRLLRAYPADRLDLRPVETLPPARGLIHELVVSQVRVQAALAPAFGRPDVPAPAATLEGLVERFAAAHAVSAAALAALGDADFDAAVRVPTGPGTWGERRRGDLLWIVLYDAIHLRGQLTIYTRMAGGVVPPIYSPILEPSLDPA